MKIIMANDHAAVELKNELKSWLLEQGHTVEDLGIGDGEKADYPDMGEKAARLYMEGGYDYGVLCCGTGIGISISANKVNGIRCALPQNIFAAAAAREHNDCQFIAFGGRIEYPEKPTDMLAAFLSAVFAGERHQRRVDKILAIETNPRRE